ncbi:hypothetical protein ACFWDM_27995, partial [Streptomyces diastaticus]
PTSGRRGRGVPGLPAGGGRELLVLTGAALAHLAVAGRVLHAREAELAGRQEGASLAPPHTQPTALIRSLHGRPPSPPRPA